MTGPEIWRYRDDEEYDETGDNLDSQRYWEDNPSDPEEPEREDERLTFEWQRDWRS